MFKILKANEINKNIIKMEIEAQKIALKANPGQFVIILPNEYSERIPLTIADYNLEKGTITIIFQVVGSSTSQLAVLKEGDYILDVVGPLGRKSELDNLKKVCVIGGGVGCAISYPITKRLFEKGTIVHTIVGFRNKELVILEDDFKKISSEFYLMTDDGSSGQKGLVTNKLEELIEAGNQYDEVIAIGPLVMMKFVSLLTKKYNIKTVVSMNPIMIDGTGMCGCCRLTVDGKMVFACVDGPDFDGHKVDFDEAIARNRAYIEEEKNNREKTCNLFKGEAHE